MLGIGGKLARLGAVARRGGGTGLFAHVLEELAVATFAIDRNRRVIIWNKACAELTGVAAGAMINTNKHWTAFYSENRPCLADIVLDGTRAQTEKLYAQSHSKGRREAGLAAENWFDLPCGRRAYLVVDAYPILQANGELVAVVETLRDITAEKLAAQETEAIRIKAAEDEAKTSAERQKAIAATGAGLALLAAKDLSSRITDDMPAAFKTLRSDFNAAVDQLASAFAGVTNACSQITSGAQEISIAAHDVAERADQQARTLDQATTALNKITELLSCTAADSERAHGDVKEATANAMSGEAIVGRAVNAMSAIEQSSQEITEIVDVIDDIATQTSLLALNAGVEAARAGAAGKGFAVVASETRALAQRSSQAARRIKTLVGEAQARIAAGSELVGDSGGAFRSILASVKSIERAIASIAGNAGEQTAMLRDVEHTLEAVNDHTTQNAAAAQQTSAIGNAFAEAAENLSRTVSLFRLPARLSSAHTQAGLAKATNSAGGAHGGKAAR